MMNEKELRLARARMQRVYRNLDHASALEKDLAAVLDALLSHLEVDRPEPIEILPPSEIIGGQQVGRP